MDGWMGGWVSVLWLMLLLLVCECECVCFLFVCCFAKKEAVQSGQGDQRPESSSKKEVENLRLDVETKYAARNGKKKKRGAKTIPNEKRNERDPPPSLQ